MDKKPSLNVYDKPLISCSKDPMTGFYRDGCCKTGPDDSGTHVVCAVMTKEFLEFTRKKGNDLSTPIPAYDFPGLKPGDKWCLCVSRWAEAERAGKAPKVDLQATLKTALKTVSLATLEDYAID